MSKEWFGNEHLLTNALRRGVAFHFGPLPHQLRQSIEDEFRKNQIRILVCTSTLAQGVNLPIKTAIIYSLEQALESPQADGSQKIFKVKKRDFWNICGRAGRAGKETEGQIIFMDITHNDERIIAEYTNPNNIEEVTSALYKILRQLVNGRISNEELYEYLDSHVLAIMAEEIIDTDDESAIVSLLQKSLVGIQARRKNQDLEPLARAFQKTSLWIKESVEEKSLLNVFSRTGLRLSSCIRLHEAAVVFCKNVKEDYLSSIANQSFCDFLLLEAAFRACKDLPEMKFATRTGISYQGPEDEYQIIHAWVTGKPITEIKTEFWNDGDIESLSEYISDRVAYKLPWGIHSFLVIVSNILNRKFEGLPILWQNVPSMVKFGVSTLTSAWAGSTGVSSRDFCIQLSEKYPGKTISFLIFLKWLANLSTDFVDNELAGTDTQKQRFIAEISNLIPDNVILDFYTNPTKKLQVLIAGIRYNNRYVAANQISLGDRLSIEKEPDNSMDPNAIKVLFNDQMIGYVPKDRTKLLLQEIDAENIKQITAYSVTPPTN